MTPRRWMIGIALASLLLLNGCRHCCHKRGNCPAPNGPTGPTTGPGNLPPQNIPLDPPPNRGSFSSPEVLLPSSVPPVRSGYTPSSSKSTVILGEPDFGAPIVVEPKKSTKQTAPPPNPAVDESPMGSPFPAGIAGFAQVKEGVTNGQRPDLEGLDWLQSKGYKTVLFLRNGNDDDSSDRKQVEKRGMKYQTLTVAPDSINPNLVTEFNRIVNDADGRPLFVYDLNGTQAGAMWYLHFRTSDLLNDDQARVRAGRLGLKEKADAEQTQLWTAVQKYLSERNPN